MNRTLKLISKYKIPGLLIALVFLSGLKFIKNSSDETKTSQEITTEQEHLDHHDHVHEVKAEQPKTKVANAEKAQRKPQGKIASDSFKNQLDKVADLSKKYPESKPQLLDIITKEDPFKTKGIEPHTNDEIMQRKLGAVKVVALRSLLEKETDQDTLKRDLINISRLAKDPTIHHIAKAALKSVEDGRSFFDDHLDGVDITVPE